MLCPVTPRGFTGSAILPCPQERCVGKKEKMAGKEQERENRKRRK